MLLPIVKSSCWSSERLRILVLTTQYILEMTESIAVACGAAGWIWRHQSLLLPHFRSNVVTHDDIARFQKVKTNLQQRVAQPRQVPIIGTNLWGGVV